MSQTQERRFIVPKTIRGGKTDGKRVLSGYAAKFNVLSEDLGGWRERLAPGAFKASLASGRDIKFFADHDSGKLLGRRANGSLTVEENSIGLSFRLELPNTSVGDDVYELCRSGLLNEMSFGFMCGDESWGDEPDPDDRGGRPRTIPVRTVKAATLLELSCVSMPAYPQTSVTVDAAARSLFPGGAMPVEIRSRIKTSTSIPAPIGDEERCLRRLAEIRIAMLGEL